jgi:hypothetical protein
MGWNDYDVSGAGDGDIQEVRELLYAAADLLWFMRLVSSAGPNDLLAGLADWAALRHPMLRNDGQKRPDIPVPDITLLDSDLVTEEARDRAADLMHHLADALSWLQSSEDR